MAKILIGSLIFLVAACLEDCSPKTPPFPGLPLPLGSFFVRLHLAFLGSVLFSSWDEMGQENLFSWLSECVLSFIQDLRVPGWLGAWNAVQGRHLRVTRRTLSTKQM